MLPIVFRYIWPSGFREDLKKSTNQKKIIACGGHVFLTDREEMCNPYRGPSIATSYKVLVHLANLSGFRREYIFQIDQSATRIACGSHVC
jgi:hypothetical protein